MDDDAAQGRSRHRRRGNRVSRPGLLTAVLIAAAVGVAGCGGDDGPSPVTTSGATTAGSSATAGGGDVSAYTQCMRSHGVPNYPGSGSQGQVQINGGVGEGGIDINSPQFQSAQQACQSVAPSPLSPAQRRAAAVAYSHCMRAHGVKNFPDPNAEGGLQIGPDVDVTSPAYRSAQAACPAVPAQ